MEKLAEIIENVVFVIIGFYIGKFYVGARIQKKIKDLKAQMEIWTNARNSKIDEILETLEKIQQGLPKEDKY